MKDEVSFGHWIRRRRKSLDLTQRQLAERVGCATATIVKIEADERRPSREIAQLLAQRLEVPLEERAEFMRVARGERRVAVLALPEASVAVIPPTVSPSSVSRLPAPLTPLIGRQRELAAIRQMLPDLHCRLLTLTGPGGMGKTRLAIEAAAQHATDFSGGAYFVPLASLGSAAFLALAIADSLGLKFQGHTEPRAQLLNYLHDKSLLLVLDNFEHLLSGVELLAEILEHLPGVKLLITSRERLSLPGEWVFEIQGLPVPAAEDSDGSVETSAVTLFKQCAIRARGNFALDADEEAAVVRVCQLVEGMPLGIELAASWMRVLSCQEIAREIEGNLDFLATTARHIPERHRSLRAVFEHSWNLLPPPERELLRQLAVFHGGFQREAAEQVAGATLSGLRALVDKSLVRRAPSGRYDLHEAVRQYALTHLASDPPGEAAVRERHSAFHLGLVKAREMALRGAAQPETIRELTDEIDNIRAAWEWAVEHAKYWLIGSALRCLTWFYDMRGWLGEGAKQVERIVQILRVRAEDREQPVLGQALAQQGLLYEFQGQFSRAQTLLEESLVVLRSIGDPALLVDPLIHYGIVKYVMGEINLAQTFVCEGLACARATADEWSTAYALCNQGQISIILGRYAEGYEQMLGGLAIWRALGDSRATALGLNWLSLAAIHLGRHEEALAFLQESLARSTQVGDRWGMGTAYRHRGLVAMAQGDLTEAQFHIHLSLELFTDLGTRWDLAQSLICSGEVTAASGNSSEAEHLYRDALDLAIETNATPLALDALLGLAHLKAGASDPQAALRLACYAAAHPSSTQATRDRAKQLSQQLLPELTAQQLEASRMQPGRTLAEIAQEFLG